MVTRLNALAVTENQKTMALVRSVATSLRTNTCASEEHSAPISTTIAPSASRSLVVPMPPSRGESTISTPIRPRATAASRNARTCSPRNIAAKTTVSNGEA